MTHHYVIDTNALIYFYCDLFEQECRLSSKAIAIMRQGLSRNESLVRLSIPSVVFVEIYAKWLRDEEFAAKFYYEVFKPLTESPNVEVKPIEREVLENLISIGGILEKHEMHDKIILASAIMLKCRLISTDPVIEQYVADTGVIPAVLK